MSSMNKAELMDELHSRHPSDKEWRKTNLKKFNINFLRSHTRKPELNLSIRSVGEIIKIQPQLRMPSFVIARKQGKFWKITEKIFAEELWSLARSQKRRQRRWAIVNYPNSPPSIVPNTAFNPLHDWQEVVTPSKETSLRTRSPNCINLGSWAGAGQEY